MNLSMLPKKIPADKRRLIIIIATGILAIVIAIYYPTKPEPVMAPSVVLPSNNSGGAISTPVMPNGYQAGNKKEMRDPFALPSRLQNANGETTVVTQKNSADTMANGISSEKSISIPKNSSTNTASRSKPNHSTDLKLTGTVGTNGVWLAVIQSGNKSKMYKPDDSVGSYKIVSIDEETVILTGPEGVRTLSLQSVGQIGGGKYEH